MTCSRSIRRLPAASDANGAGRADLIVVAGPGSLGPNVRVLSGLDLTELRSVAAVERAFVRGVVVR